MGAGLGLEGPEADRESGFSRTMIARSGYGRPGFAAAYDRYRPAPPPALLTVLAAVAQVERPALVVDLGAGTGLSSRAWAGRAERVVGVEANPAMITEARRAAPAALTGEAARAGVAARGGEAARGGGPEASAAAQDARPGRTGPAAPAPVPGVRYLAAFAHRTGLAAGRADIVTCAQAFHWMDPASVLAEAARILRPGGVFAAYDYDLPPVVQPEVDAAFAAHFAARVDARDRLGLAAGAARHPKAAHLDRIRASGHFRFAREIVCHGCYRTGAEHLLGLARSLGGPAGLSEAAAPAVAESFRQLARTANRLLGSRTWPMLVCYRIRLGVV